MIIDDLKAKATWLYGASSKRKILRAALSDASLCMVMHRGMSFCHKLYILKPVAAIICKVNALLCGAVIGMGVSFGKGLVILHSVGLVINTRVVGGEYIYLESGVVIGETKRGCPVLGNNVFVGSGAKIIGDITIGNNVTIGANAVVNKSFPDNVVIGGVPAKILRYKNNTETLVG